MSVTIAQVIGKSDSYLREYSGYTDVESLILHTKVLSLLDYFSMLRRDDTVIVRSESFKRLYLYPDVDLYDKLRQVSSAFSTRLDAVLLVMALTESDTAAARLLGRDSSDLWIVEMSEGIAAVLDAYAEGLTLSGNLSMMEESLRNMVATEHTAEARRILEAEVRDKYLRMQALEMVPSVIQSVLRDGTPRDIITLYDNSPSARRLMQQPASINLLKKRFPSYHLESFSEFEEYARTSITYNDCMRKAKNRRKCLIQSIALSLRVGRLGYLKNNLGSLWIESKDEYMLLCRSAGRSHNEDVIKLFVKNVKYPSVKEKERNTEMLRGSIPGNIMPVVREVGKRQSSSMRIHTFIPGFTEMEDVSNKVRAGIEVISSESFDIPKVIDRILEVGHKLEDYLTEGQIVSNERAIAAAVLRQGLTGYNISLEGTKQEYLDAVKGGNIDFVISARGGSSKYDNEALEIAVRENSIPIVKWIVKEGGVTEDTLHKVMLEAARKDNVELVEVFGGVIGYDDLTRVELGPNVVELISML